MRRRRASRSATAIIIGAALCALYMTVALVSSRAIGSVRPLYEGPCPPQQCPPCPPTCPTYSPYSPTPTSTPPPTTPPPPPPSTPPPTSGPPASSGGGTPTPRPTSPATSAPGSTSQGTSPGAPSSSSAASASAGGSASASAVATPEATPPPASSSAIGPSGGSSRSSDGELEVVVPAGALTAPTTFVIGPVPGGAPPLPDGRGPVTPVIDVTAYGPGKVPVTVFNRPLRLVFHYKAAQPQVIASWDGQEWVNMATSVDPGAHIATATAPHLTPLVAFSSATASLFFTVPVQVPVGGIVVIVIALLIVGGTTAVARLRLTPTAGPA